MGGEIRIQQPRFAPLLDRQDEIIALLRAKTQRKFIARKLNLNINSLDLFARHLRRTGALEPKVRSPVRQRHSGAEVVSYIAPAERQQLDAKCFASGLSRSDYVAALIRKDLSGE
jgi:hypothetical protein